MTPTRHLAKPFFAATATLLTTFAIALPLIRREKSAADALAEGKYLVEGVAICFECHSERDRSKPGWPIPPGRAGGGRIMAGEGTANPLVAPNISPDKSTGIGAWNDAEIERAIRDGTGRDGRRLNPEMPSRYFRQFSPAELGSIVAYLRSIPPVHHALPRMPPYVPGPHPPTIAMDSLRLTTSSEQIQRGANLVRLAGCETCHTPANASGYLPGLDFAGGTVFQHGDQSAAASNLTSDPSGLSYYDEALFLRVMRTGRVGGRQLSSAMPWLFYRHMSDVDLDAIFAYLRALPRVSHRIDNSEPPTLCPKCRNRHGLGNQN